MSRKTLGLFIGLFSAVVGLTLLRDIVKGSPLMILGVSSVLSIIISLISIYITNKKRNHLLVNDSKLLDSSLISRDRAMKINRMAYNIAKQANIKIPQISVFESDHHVAYSYQLLPQYSYIKLSHSLINTYSEKSLSGIISHEISHIKNRDSWKSVLRFVNWVFVLSVGFFFLQKSTAFLIPIIAYYELNKMREKEYESDAHAVIYSSLDDVLNCLMDSYYIQEQNRNEIIKKYEQESKFRDKIKKFYELANYDFQILIFNYLGTHPNWQKRIRHCLVAHNVELTTTEFERLLKKFLLFRQSYGMKRSIDWDKMGLLAQKIINNK